MLPPKLYRSLPFLAFILPSRAQPPEQTFFPPSVPLAVRSPYLNTWYRSEHDAAGLSGTWPTFALNPPAIIGWNGKIRVDNSTYEWLGDDTRSGNRTLANVTGFRVTPTRSIFTMQAGPMNLTVTFLTPITPSDLARQSIPLSYVSIEASSLDGRQHSVQVYSDITGEWLAGNRAARFTWSLKQTATSVSHSAQLPKPTPNKEVGEQTSDGVLYHAMASRTGLTYQSDPDTVCRLRFKSVGALANTTNADKLTPIDNPWTVFAISVDLGSIQQTSEPVAWAVGFVRNSVVPYALASGEIQPRVPYFLPEYGSVQGAVDAFVSDFPNALRDATALDERILGNASKVSKEYADLLSISTRQVFASLDITLAMAPGGTFNTSDVKVFMKDMGGAGRVNPVEVIYAALPALLYLEASSLTRGLLAPLLEAQESPKYQVYAAPDIGVIYPVANGNPVSHASGIDHSASMLIMVYAHAVTSGDITLVQQHHLLLKKWADYLVNNTLTPSNQLVDSQTKTNGTNLAVKGIIGVAAMAKMSHVVHEDEDARQYDERVSSLSRTWQSLAVSSDKTHLLGTYKTEKSWALMYNLYYDKLLGLNVVDQSVLNNQATFYSSLLDSSTAQQFGLPIDSDVSQGNSAWDLFTAATMTDVGVRDKFIHAAWARASFNQSIGPNPSLYDVSTGAAEGGQAGAAQGAMYAILALDVPKKFAPIESQQAERGSHKAPVGAIAGGVVGGIVIIALGVLAGYLLRRRRKAPPPPKHHGEFDQFTYQGPVTPGSYSYDNLASASHRGPSTNALPSSVCGDDLSSSEVGGLRAEVAHLRRVMEEVRDTAAVEPLPRYEG